MELSDIHYDEYGNVYQYYINPNFDKSKNKTNFMFIHNNPQYLSSSFYGTLINKL